MTNPDKFAWSGCPDCEEAEARTLPTEMQERVVSLLQKLAQINETYGFPPKTDEEIEE